MTQKDDFDEMLKEIFLNKKHGERRCMGTCSEDESDSDRDIFEEMFKEIFLNKKHGERRCMGTCCKSTCSDPKKVLFYGPLP